MFCSEPCLCLPRLHLLNRTSTSRCVLDPPFEASRNSTGSSPVPATRSVAAQRRNRVNLCRMASNYPLPPATTTGDDSTSSIAPQPLAQPDGASLSNETQQHAVHDVHHSFIDTNQAAAAVAAAAQHGLQALEAANGLPSPPPMSNPVIPQFSPAQDNPYLAAASNGSPLTAGIASLPADQASPVTKQPHKRLSKACDLCSQRKVKVNTLQLVSEKNPQCAYCFLLSAMGSTRADPAATSM